jgi:KDO2-lipid IV(A) lauroyltransferase
VVLAIPDSTRSSAKFSWWIRVLSRIPLALWYPVASGMAWLSWRVVPYRRQVVEANLRAAFPEWDEATRERVIRDYYRGFADMLVEIVHSLRLTRAELERRVTLVNPQLMVRGWCRRKDC